MYNNPHVRFKMGDYGKNIITYGSGPRINIDSVGNVWGHFPFRIFTYTPTVETYPLSITGVDRGLKDPTTVCKIGKFDNEQLKYIPAQSNYRRQKQLENCKLKSTDDCSGVLEKKIDKVNFKTKTMISKLPVKSDCIYVF